MFKRFLLAAIAMLTLTATSNAVDTKFYRITKGFSTGLLVHDSFVPKSIFLPPSAADTTSASGNYLFRIKAKNLIPLRELILEDDLTKGRPHALLALTQTHSILFPLPRENIKNMAIIRRLIEPYHHTPTKNTPFLSPAKKDITALTALKAFGWIPSMNHADVEGYHAFLTCFPSYPAHCRAYDAAQASVPGAGSNTPPHLLCTPAHKRPSEREDDITEEDNCKEEPPLARRRVVTAAAVAPMPVAPRSPQDIAAQAYRLVFETDNYLRDWPQAFALAVSVKGKDETGLAQALYLYLFAHGYSVSTEGHVAPFTPFEKLDIKALFAGFKQLSADIVLLANPPAGVTLHPFVSALIVLGHANGWFDLSEDHDIDTFRTTMLSPGKACREYLSTILFGFYCASSAAEELAAYNSVRGKCPLAGIYYAWKKESDDESTAEEKYRRLGGSHPRGHTMLALLSMRQRKSAQAFRAFEPALAANDALAFSEYPIHLARTAALPEAIADAYEMARRQLICGTGAGLLESMPTLEDGKVYVDAGLEAGLPRAPAYTPAPPVVPHPPAASPGTASSTSPLS